MRATKVLPPCPFSASRAAPVHFKISRLLSYDYTPISLRARHRTFPTRPQRLLLLTTHIHRRFSASTSAFTVVLAATVVLTDGMALTLAGICRLAPALQLCVHLDNHWTDSSLYIREGPGMLYCCGRVPTATLAAFRQAAITRAAFLAELELKYGFAADFDRRRRAYSQCDEGGWTHLWFWVFHTDYRVVAERLNHLIFLDDGAPRVLRRCDGCLVRHREFWRYRDIGDFSRLRLQGELVLAALGDVNAFREDLEDIDIAFPT
ncbi:hypothetical protein B0H11DRAFT_2236389 [Mycena galericulata]|nr:hypothetical protein B0H11DRAFT_2236389 [Mycena galericulata]